MGQLPSERKAPRRWRTREDAFAEDWPEIAERLTAAPELEAKALFEDQLRRRLTLAGWEAERSGVDRLPVGRVVKATGGAGGRGDGWTGRFRLRQGGAGVAGVVVAANAAVYFPR